MTICLSIIGAGPGGYVAAVRAAQLGARVTLVEADHLGGTCLNWGCIPSKLMKATADRIEAVRQAPAFGVRLSGSPELDVAVLNQRKEKVIQTQRKGIAGLMAHHGVRCIQGRGRIQGPGQMAVSLADGTAETVNWDRLILATGSRPAPIPAFPFDGRRIISSNEALYLEAIPESVVIVGGGVIGCEFAYILSALGSQVTVVETLDRLLPLPSVDADCSKVLLREMKKQKIACHVNRTVTSMIPLDGSVRVAIGPSPLATDPKDRGRAPVELTASTVLVCIGRTPNTDDVGLETLGVETDARGWVCADGRMATRVDGVYAIGDVLGPDRVMLAHVASAEGMVAAENAMGGHRTMEYAAIPGAIFTSPEVATVGLTEAQAVAQGIDARADTVLFRALGKAQVIGELAGQAKIVSDRIAGRVLGVQLIGPHATELIAEGVLAVETGCTVGQLARTIHAHPTLAEIMSETAHKALGQTLHG
ncbi:MAG: dihydrolipoyl dehydrogenase [Desulfobacterales bacterium]|nr:dihydrolipoyl dehydrogenase [Desulfobacterales bacterium]